MRIISILFILLNLCVTTSAQTAKDKGLAAINLHSAEAHIMFLAHNELDGREAGYKGSRIAREYLVAQLRKMKLQPIDQSYYQPFEAFAEKKKAERTGRFRIHADSIKEIIKSQHVKLEMTNILAMIPGKNTNEYVIIGAHYDHLGFDDNMPNDGIYNGADDNASGVSAVLQIAEAFLASGEKPLRNVIFAFWDGEEKGLLGSTYYVQTCPYISKVKAYLNFDMIGRNSDENNPTGVDYFYTEAKPIFEKWTKDDISHYKLNLKPTYRAWDNPAGGSDNTEFARKGIPIIWYHTSGHADYHQPSDHAEKLNWSKLIDITKVSYLNFWHMANDASF